MKNRYAKGANLERKLIELLLLTRRYAFVTRTAGSHGAVDIIAIKKKSLPISSLLIQVKAGKNITAKENAKLEELAREVGGEAEVLLYMKGAQQLFRYVSDLGGNVLTYQLSFHLFPKLVLTNQ